MEVLFTTDAWAACRRLLLGAILYVLQWDSTPFTRLFVPSLSVHCAVSACIHSVLCAMPVWWSSCHLLCWVPTYTHGEHCSCTEQPAMEVEAGAGYIFCRAYWWAPCTCVYGGVHLPVSTCHTLLLCL
jgi:hypothetical protein